MLIIVEMTREYRMNFGFSLEKKSVLKKSVVVSENIRNARKERIIVPAI